MPKVHSHYENLKVARDAPPEAIRAAYRALTRQHHPDRHPDDAQAQRIMAMVNVAYAVLSDPARRREHDLWIRQAEEPTARPVRHRHTLHSPVAGGAGAVMDGQAMRRARQWRPGRRMARFTVHLLRHRLAYAGVAIGGLCLAMVFGRTLLAPGLGPQIADLRGAASASPRAGYTRPPTAPSGRAWPAQAGYVDGYAVLNMGGLSEVTIDNSRNDADMFAKLVSLDGPTAFPVRTVFVAAHGRFRIADLSIGTYDLRYRNLATGGLLRSPAFILEEVRTAGGTQHSAITVPLYAAGAGSLQTYELGEAEFF